MLLLVSTSTTRAGSQLCRQVDWPRSRYCRRCRLLNNSVWILRAVLAAGREGVE